MFGIVLLGLSFLACAPEVPDETTVQEPEVAQTEQPEHLSGPPSTNDSSGKSGCDLYGTVENEVNGMKIPVPVECDPYYFDKGDPPPEKLNPVKQFVNES